MSEIWIMGYETTPKIIRERGLTATIQRIKNYPRRVQDVGSYFS